MTLYRDPLAGLRSQIATKRGLLESRERALPMLVRAMLPERLTKVLGKRRENARPESEPESFEQLSSVDASLDEILAAHDEAAELAPKLRACPDEVPDPNKSHLSPPWTIEETPQLEFRKLFTDRLGEIAPDAYLIRWDDSTYLSRFTLAGAPLIVSCRFSQSGNLLDLSPCWARTSVPAELPSLEVHEEGVFHSLGRLLHLVRDHQTGDAAFDDRFIVDADDVTAGIIGSDVRHAFDTMSALAPQLYIRHGVAELSWRSSWNMNGASLVPDAAFAILLGLRAAIERA